MPAPTHSSGFTTPSSVGAFASLGTETLRLRNGFSCGSCCAAGSAASDDEEMIELMVKHTKMTAVDRWLTGASPIEDDAEYPIWTTVSARRALKCVDT